MGSNCCKGDAARPIRSTSSIYSRSRAGASLDDRFTSSEDAGGVRLSVSAAQTGDSGIYTLQASNAAGSDTCKIRLEVSAEEAPVGEDPPAFLRRLQDLTVKVGSRTRFLVEIISSTECKVTWYRNERRLLEAERVALARDGNFWCADVAAVSVDDAGRWTCTAENAGGRASCSAHLNVLVPKAYKRPEFMEELRALLTEQGTVSLECKVVGVPTPVLRWFKDSREIKAGDVFALTANAEDPTSLGTYTCEAVNCMGRAYSSSKVHVVGRASREGSARPSSSGMTPEPPPIFTKELEDAHVKICEHLTLGCHIVVPPWPRSVVWYNKEGKLEPGARYHAQEDGVGGYLLDIPFTEWADEGEWKCVATSAGGRVGISTCYVAMDVPKNYRKPRFMENLQAVLTEEGLVSFECKVVGFPTPVLSWFKDGQELKPGDVYQLTGTNSLGSYCCIARNCMGKASSSAELTVEDIQNQLNEEEKLQLFSKNQAPKFIQGLKSVEAKIDEPFRFIVKVAIPPEPSVLWYRDDQPVDESNRCHLEKEDKGIFNLDIQNLEFLDQAEWKCVAMNDFGHSVTSCFLKLIIPRHYKKPRFLENLQAILSDEGAVNLECKVIGVPQPVLKWYKDGEELKPGDIHRIISGQDGTCCLGTYTCEAQNCMGIAASSASLLGFDDSMKAKAKKSEDQALQRNLSLSTIHEERTSQMYDTPVGDITLDDKGEISFSFDGKEVSVSLYETPDLTEEEALQIVEMYADQLSENVTEHNVVELPPLRFVKETSTSGNLLMEAIIIDVSPEYFPAPDERTEADVEDLSIADENGPPQLSLDQDIEDGGEDYLQKTMALLSDEKSDFAAKSSRKKSDSQRSIDDFYSLSRDQSLSEEKRDDDTYVSESELQSFASARSSAKIKSKSSKPSDERSEPTKTILMKEEAEFKLKKEVTKQQESEVLTLKPKRERRTSRGSRRSSTSSEKSIGKSREELLRFKTDIEQIPKQPSMDIEEFRNTMGVISTSLTKVINDVQLIERDIILESELMSSAATASRSLEIISSLITPLSEINSIADAAKESVSESREVASTVFNTIPQPLKALQQSLTIIEKCIDMESDNKTLVKKTCVAFIETCGTGIQKVLSDITSVTSKDFLKAETKIINEIDSVANETTILIKFSTETIKARNLLTEASEIKQEEPTVEAKHLRDTQKAVFELKTPLNSLLRIVENAENEKVTDLFQTKNNAVIMHDMSASIQDLQTALEQIENLSVKESTSNLQKHNTDIIETVMESVLKLRNSFELLSTEPNKEEEKPILKHTLKALKENLTEISLNINAVDEKVGQFDVLQSENKLEILQKMAQILIALENNLLRLEYMPEVKSNLDTFHKNLTRVLENVIESNDAKKYVKMMEICETVNIINSSVKNMDSENILPLASLSNSLKIIRNNFIVNVFESELNSSLLDNISDILVGIEEVINKAEEVCLQIESENIKEMSTPVFDVAKVKVILEQIDQTIAAVNTIKIIESTQELKMALAPTLENICPILEELRRCVASVRPSGVEQDEHISEISETSLAQTLASPLCELNQNIIILNQIIVDNIEEIKDNFEIITAFAEPLHELHSTLEIIQHDVISQYGDDLTPYEVSVNMASVVQNLQSCIVMIHEQAGVEGADDMSTLEDISGIKTTADNIPSDHLVLPTTEETAIEQSFPSYLEQKVATTATAQRLQDLNEHITVLQSPEVIEALDTLSEVSDYFSLKSVVVGLGDLHAGLQGILHPVPIEGSIDLEDLANISKLAAIAEPMQDIQQSLSILDTSNIPIYENILDLPAEKVHSVFQTISEFKSSLEQCMNAVLPAMEITKNTIEISNKVSTLREVCEQLKDIFETAKDATSDTRLPSEIHALEHVVDSLINATDVSKEIRIEVVKSITEQLYSEVIKAQEDIIQFTAQTPEKLSQEAKLIQIVNDVQNNIAALEQYDFIDLSQASDLSTACISPQIAFEIDSEVLTQVYDIAENAVDVLHDSYQEIPPADLRIVEDFFKTCKNEFTILSCLISKATSHKKIIRLLQEFSSLQVIINNFTSQRLDFHLSDKVNECLTTYLIHADECLRCARSTFIQIIDSQSDMLIKTPISQMESIHELEHLMKSEPNTPIGNVVKILIECANVSKSLTDNLQRSIINELSQAANELKPTQNEIVVAEKLEELAAIVGSQSTSCSQNLEGSSKFIFNNLNVCVTKHQDYKDAIGTGKTLIAIKCLAECVKIVNQEYTQTKLSTDETHTELKENLLKEVLTEMLQPLQSLQVQLINIQEQILAGADEDSISIDITTTESIIQTMTELHQDIVQQIESDETIMDVQEIDLIKEVDKEIHTIQDSIMSMDNGQVAQVVKKITKPIEDIEKSLQDVLSTDKDTGEKTLPKETTSQLLDTIDQYIELIEIVEEISAVIKIEDVKESFDIARELKQIISVSENISASVEIQEKRTRLALKLQTSLSALHIQVLDSAQELAPVLSADALQRITQVTAQLQANLVAVTGYHVPVQATVPFIELTTSLESATAVLSAVSEPVEVTKVEDTVQTVQKSTTEEIVQMDIEKGFAIMEKEESTKIKAETSLKKESKTISSRILETPQQSDEKIEEILTSQENLMQHINEYVSEDIIEVVKELSSILNSEELNQSVMIAKELRENVTAIEACLTEEAIGIDIEKMQERRTQLLQDLQSSLSCISETTLEHLLEVPFIEKEKFAKVVLMAENLKTDLGTIQVSQPGVLQAVIQDEIKLGTEFAIVDVVSEIIGDTAKPSFAHSLPIVEPVEQIEPDKEGIFVEEVRVNIEMKQDPDTSIYKEQEVIAFAQSKAIETDAQVSQYADSTNTVDIEQQEFVEQKKDDLITHDSDALKTIVVKTSVAALPEIKEVKGPIECTFPIPTTDAEEKPIPPATVAEIVSISEALVIGGQNTSMEISTEHLSETVTMEKYQKETATRVTKSTVSSTLTTETLIQNINAFLSDDVLLEVCEEIISVNDINRAQQYAKDLKEQIILSKLNIGQEFNNEASIEVVQEFTTLAQQLQQALFDAQDKLEQKVSKVSPNQTYEALVKTISQLTENLALVVEKQHNNEKSSTNADISIYVPTLTDHLPAPELTAVAIILQENINLTKDIQNMETAGVAVPSKSDDQGSYATDTSIVKKPISEISKAENYDTIKEPFSDVEVETEKLEVNCMLVDDHATSIPQDIDIKENIVVKSLGTDSDIAINQLLLDQNLETVTQQNVSTETTENILTEAAKPFEEFFDAPTSADLLPSMEIVATEYTQPEVLEITETFKSKGQCKEDAISNVNQCHISAVTSVVNITETTVEVVEDLDYEKITEGSKILDDVNSHNRNVHATRTEQKIDTKEYFATPSIDPESVAFQELAVAKPLEEFFDLSKSEDLLLTNTSVATELSHQKSLETPTYLESRKNIEIEATQSISDCLSTPFTGGIILTQSSDSGDVKCAAIIEETGSLEIEHVSSDEVRENIALNTSTEQNSKVIDKISEVLCPENLPVEAKTIWNEETKPFEKYFDSLTSAELLPSKVKVALEYEEQKILEFTQNIKHTKGTAIKNDSLTSAITNKVDLSKPAENKETRCILDEEITISEIKQPLLDIASVKEVCVSEIIVLHGDTNSETSYNSAMSTDNTQLHELETCEIIQKAESANASLSDGLVLAVIEIVDLKEGLDVGSGVDDPSLNTCQIGNDTKGPAQEQVAVCQETEAVLLEYKDVVLQEQTISNQENTENTVNELLPQDHEVIANKEEIASLETKEPLHRIEHIHLIQQIDAFISDEVTEMIDKIANITSIETLKESVVIAKKLRESLIASDYSTTDKASLLNEKDELDPARLVQRLQDALSTLHTQALDSAQVTAPIISSNALQKISEIITLLQEDLATAIVSEVKSIAVLTDFEVVDETEERNSMAQLESLLKDVNIKIYLTSTEQTRDIDNSESLKDTLDEVQTVIIKLKSEYDDASNDTFNETLEDLECSVRSVQLQINEESPPELLSEACVTLQLLVDNMNATQQVQASSTTTRMENTENIIEKCSNETDETVKLLDIASKFETKGSHNLTSVVNNLNFMRISLKSLRDKFLIDADTVIENGVEIVQCLDQIEEHIFSLEKDIDLSTNVAVSTKDSILTAVHSVYGSISNMRSTVSSVQKRYMFEHYGKPSESLLHSIKNLTAMSALEDENNKLNIKKVSKSLRKVLNHFEDIKFYINLDKTARLPSDATFTKIILEELKDNIFSILVPRAVQMNPDILQRINNSLKCVESNLKSIELDSMIEVKNKIPIFKEIAADMLKITTCMNKYLGKSKENIVSKHESPESKETVEDSETPHESAKIEEKIYILPITDFDRPSTSKQPQDVVLDESPVILNTDSLHSNIEKTEDESAVSKFQEIENIGYIEKVIMETGTNEEIIIVAEISSKSEYDPIQNQDQMEETDLKENAQNLTAIVKESEKLCYEEETNQQIEKETNDVKQNQAGDLCLQEEKQKLENELLQREAEEIAENFEKTTHAEQEGLQEQLEEGKIKLQQEELSLQKQEGDEENYQKEDELCLQEMEAVELKEKEEAELCQTKESQTTDLTKLKQKHDEELGFKEELNGGEVKEKELEEYFQKETEILGDGLKTTQVEKEEVQEIQSQNEKEMAKLKHDIQDEEMPLEKPKEEAELNQKKIDENLIQKVQEAAESYLKGEEEYQTQKEKEETQGKQEEDRLQKQKEQAEFTQKQDETLNMQKDVDKLKTEEETRMQKEKENAELKQIEMKERHLHGTKEVAKMKEQQDEEKRTQKDAQETEFKCREEEEKEANVLKQNEEIDERLLKEKEITESKHKQEEHINDKDQRSRKENEKSELKEKENEVADLKQKEEEELRLQKEKEADDLKQKENEELRLQKEKEESDLKVKENQRKHTETEEEELRLQKEKEMAESKQKQEAFTLKQKQETTEMKQKQEEEEKEADDQKQKENEERCLQKEKEESELKEKENQRKQKENEEEKLSLLKEKEMAELKQKQEALMLKQEKEATEMKLKQEEEHLLKKEKEEKYQCLQKEKEESENQRKQKEKEEEELRLQKEKEMAESKQKQEVLTLKQKKETTEMKQKQEEELCLKEAKEADDLKQKENEKLRIQKEKEMAESKQKEETLILQQEKGASEIKQKKEEELRLKEEKVAEDLKQKENEELHLPKENEESELKMKENRRKQKEKEEEEIHLQMKKEIAESIQKQEALILQQETEAAEVKHKKEEELRLKKEKEAYDMKQKENDERRLQKEKEESELKEKEYQRKQKETEGEELRLRKETEMAESKRQQEALILQQEKEAAENKQKKEEKLRLKIEKDTDNLKQKEKEESKLKEKENERKEKEEEEKELRSQKEKEESESKQKQEALILQQEKEAAEIKQKKEEELCLKKEKEADDLKQKETEERRLQKEKEESESKEKENQRTQKEKEENELRLRKEKDMAELKLKQEALILQQEKETSEIKQKKEEELRLKEEKVADDLKQKENEELRLQKEKKESELKMIQKKQKEKEEEELRLQKEKEMAESQQNLEVLILQQEKEAAEIKHKKEELCLQIEKEADDLKQKENEELRLQKEKEESESKEKENQRSQKEKEEEELRLRKEKNMAESKLKQETLILQQENETAEIKQTKEDELRLKEEKVADDLKQKETGELRLQKEKEESESKEKENQRTQREKEDEEVRLQKEKDMAESKLKQETLILQQENETAEIKQKKEDELRLKEEKVADDLKQKEIEELRLQKETKDSELKVKQKKQKEKEEEEFSLQKEKKMAESKQNQEALILQQEKEGAEIKHKTEEELRLKKEKEAHALKQKANEELRLQKEKEESDLQLKENQRKQKEKEEEELRLQKEKEMAESKQKQETLILQQEKEAAEIKQKKEELRFKKETEAEDQKQKENEELRLQNEKEEFELKVKENERKQKEKEEEELRLQKEKEMAESKQNQEALILQQKKEAAEIKQKTEEELRLKKEKDADDVKQKENEELRLQKEKEESESKVKENQRTEQEKEEEELHLQKKEEMAESKQKQETLILQQENEAAEIKLQKEENLRPKKEKESYDLKQKEDEELRLQKENDAVELKQKEKDKHRQKKAKDTAELNEKQNEKQRLKQVKEAAELKEKLEKELLLQKKREANELKQKRKEKLQQKAEIELKQKKEEDIGLKIETKTVGLKLQQDEEYGLLQKDVDELQLRKEKEAAHMELMKPHLQSEKDKAELKEKEEREFCLQKDKKSTELKQKHEELYSQDKQEAQIIQKQKEENRLRKGNDDQEQKPKKEFEAHIHKKNEKIEELRFIEEKTTTDEMPKQSSKYAERLDINERRDDEHHVFKNDSQENGNFSHKSRHEVSHEQHYIKEYQYEASQASRKVESREKPRFVDHNHRDYTMEFARPSGYRERHFDSDKTESLSSHEHLGRNATIFKTQTLVLDAQLRSSAPPYPEISISRTPEPTERHSEIRHERLSKARSEARSVISEKRTALTRDSKRKPVFSTYLTDRTAVEGSRVKLTCSVLSSSDPTVTWYKNGVIVDNKLKYRTKTVDGLVTLEVLNAIPSDSAEYSCTISNENGSVNSSANLKVYPSFEASPIPPTFTRSIRDTYHMAENELVLECRIRGQPLPTITWLKDDKPISGNNRYQAYYLADGVCRLAIDHPTPDDSGKYTCKAENSVWSDEITHVVNFTGKENRVSPNIATIEKSRFNRQVMESRRPHFTNVLSDYKVVQGGTIGLQVEIRGAPTRVEWLREGCSVTEVYRNAKTFVEQGLYTLALSDVTEKESGMYTCRAWSLQSHVDMNAAITVVQPKELDGRPAIIVGRPEKDILISVGEDVNISFRVQGEPKPKVVFMKGIRDITTSQRVCKMTSDDYVKFTLKRSVISDAGTYCILARNAYGCDRAFVTVVIRQRASSDNLISDWTYPTEDTGLNVADRKYKSVPERIPGVPNVVEGGNNWLSLAWPKSEPGPSAPVLAYKVESWLIGTEGGARWTELGITPLTSFDAFNLKQGEEYHFRVTPRNRYGWGESVQTPSPISVGSAGDRPEFSESLPGQLKVLVGTTANLSCCVKGKPVPEVVWMKNGHEIEDEDRRLSSSFNGFNCCLTIKDINIEDEARYSCEAANVHGRASTYARLAVVTDRSIWEADVKLKRERSADVAGEFPPQFTMRLRDRRVQATYPVRLTCQVIGGPHPAVTWFRDGQPVKLDLRRNHFQDEHFHTLEIAPTNLEDGGVYEVMARNSSGAVSCHCSLVVDKGIRAYVAPEFCCGLEPLYKLKDGEELRISAVVEAYPSVGVTWYRDGVRLRPSRRTIMTLDRDGQIELALAAVTSRDAGVYTCTASNEVGRASTSGKVEVTGTNVVRTPPIFIAPDEPYSKEPMFIRKPRSSEAREGDTVIIACEVVGDPKPDVYWLRDFLKPDYYRDATHFKRVGDGPEYRFEIPHAKLDYTGAYSVVAKNQYGEAKAIISLQILAKDPSSCDDTHNISYGRVEVLPRFSKELTDLLSCDGDVVEFECRLNGNPEPTIKWFHYNELIRDSQDFETTFDEGTVRLKIKQVTAEDEGTYTCEAANNLGKATSSACLVVYPPGEPNTLSQRLRRPPAFLSAASTPRSTPRSTPARSVSRTPGPEPHRLCSPARTLGPAFYTYPFNKVAEEGETVTLQCAIKGNPAPWATWDKDGVILTPSARVTIKEKEELRMIEIEEISADDVGVYRITIENEFGRQEATARIEVITHRGKFYAGVRAVSPSPRKSMTYRSRRPSTPRQD